MKRFQIFGILLLLPAMAMVFMVGCDKGAKTSPANTGGDKTTGAAGGDGGGKKVAITAPTDATVEGVVKLNGKFEGKPEARIKELKGADVIAGCMAGGGNHVLEQNWLVGKDNGLANVVVSIEPGSGKKYEIAEALRDSFKKKEVTLDQPYCAFVPHVTAVYADVQPYVIKNSAKFGHNTNIKPPEGGNNDPKNIIMLAGEVNPPRTFKHEKAPISVSCEAHSFMSAKIWTFNHPYFAVTDENGHFKIENVPSGEDLVVYIWHESMNAKKEFAKKSFSKGDNKLDGIEVSK